MAFTKGGNPDLELLSRQKMHKSKYHGLSKEKAKKMLREGMAHGQKLSPKQRDLFGLIASGKRPTKVKKKKRSY